MKNIFLWCVCLFLLSSVLVAQQRFVKFETGTLADALVKAKIENKLVFLDTYTSWCSACKWMDKTTFREDRVADFFNAHFVNVKFDTEKGEGIEIKKRYPDIYSYPTYFILDTAGCELHRIIGGGLPDEFIEKVKAGIDPQTCLSGFEQKYKTGNRERDFILSYLDALNLAGQYQEAGVIASQYICSSKENLADFSNWFLFQEYVNGNPWSREFQKLLEYKALLMANNGREVVEAKINAVLLSGAYEMFGERKEYSISAWKEIKKMVGDNHPVNTRYILTILDLIRAKQNEKVKDLVKIVNHRLIEEDLNDRKVYFLLESIQEIVIQKGSEAEKKDWKKTLDKVISVCSDKEGKEHYRGLLGRCAD